MQFGQNGIPNPKVVTGPPTASATVLCTVLLYMWPRPDLQAMRIPCHAYSTFSHLALQVFVVCVYTRCLDSSCVFGATGWIYQQCLDKLNDLTEPPTALAGCSFQPFGLGFEMLLPTGASSLRLVLYPTLFSIDIRS